MMSNGTSYPFMRQLTSAFGERPLCAAFIVDLGSVCRACICPVRRSEFGVFSIMPASALALKAEIGSHSTPPPDVTFFVVATSNPLHSLLSPTTRRSILLIRSERRASAARIAAIVCCKVLTFDPSDTIPPSTRGIAPIAAT